MSFDPNSDTKVATIEKVRESNNQDEEEITEETVEETTEDTQ